MPTGSISSNGIVEDSNYYAFRLKHQGYNNSASSSPSYKYKYQGQEWEDELGKNTYTYQWRDYDPAIARFNKIDRYAEKYNSLTPYQIG